MLDDKLLLPHLTAASKAVEAARTANRAVVTSADASLFGQPAVWTSYRRPGGRLVLRLSLFGRYDRACKDGSRRAAISLALKMITKQLQAEALRRMIRKEKAPGEPGASQPKEETAGGL